jgi:hypothetical protein
MPVMKGGIAMLVGPIQRGGRFEMREGCTVAQSPSWPKSGTFAASPVRGS